MPEMKTLADAWTQLKESVDQKAARNRLDEGDEALFYAGAMACFSLMFADNEAIRGVGKEIQQWTEDHKQMKKF